MNNNYILLPQDRRPALQEEQNSERQCENDPDNINGFREHSRFVDGREQRTGRKDEVERTHGVPGQTVCYAQDEARILSFQHQGDHGKGADGRYRHMVDHIQPQSDPALKKLRKHSGQAHEPSGIQEMDAFEQEPAEQQFARTVDDLCSCIHSSRQVFWWQNKDRAVRRGERIMAYFDRLPLLFFGSACFS